MPDEHSVTDVAMRLIESRAGSSHLRIGAGGHRVLDGKACGFVAGELDALFSLLADYKSADKQVTAVTSLAIGADQLFADAALRQGVPIEVILPFVNFAEDFAEGAERDSYERLLSSAASITCLPWRDRSNGAYLAGGLWVVDHCDVFVAIWNGDKAAAVGDTGDVVKYCMDAGKPCIHIHSETLEVRLLQGQATEGC